jgi:hypothetical protein
MLREEDAPYRQVGLRPRGAGEPGVAFLRRAEAKLAAIYPPAMGQGHGPPGPPHMGAIGALMWGALFGRVLVEDLDGVWRFPRWNGQPDGGVLDFAVVVPVPGQGTGADCYPMRRVYKFVNVDREDDLVTIYRWLRDWRAGAWSPDTLVPGEWVGHGEYRLRARGDARPDAPRAGPPRGG